MARPATPPTTPPAIAPVLLLGWGLDDGAFVAEGMDGFGAGAFQKEVKSLKFMAWLLTE